MEKDIRYFLASLAFTAFFTLLALAFPNMSRLITIPGAIISLVFALYFVWPEIKTFKRRGLIILSASIAGLSLLIGATLFYINQPRRLPLEVYLSEARQLKAFEFHTQNFHDLFTQIKEHAREIPIVHCSVNQNPIPFNVIIRNVGDTTISKARLIIESPLDFTPFSPGGSVSSSKEVIYELSDLRPYSIGGEQNNISLTFPVAPLWTNVVIVTEIISDDYKPFFAAGDISYKIDPTISPKEMRCED